MSEVIHKCIRIYLLYALELVENITDTPNYLVQL